MSTKTSNEDIGIAMAVLATKVDRMAEDIIEIKLSLQKDYVTQSQFAPIQKIVYGMVTVILLAVVSALVALVVFKK